MARIETEDQIEAGKTRRPYEDQDVIYFIHPTKWAVSRVLADYESRKRTVGGTSLLDKCFPCIFNGIESEVPGLDPMYHDCKILCVDAPPDKARNMSTKEKVQEFIQSSIARSGEDLVKLAKHFKGVHACPTVYLVPDSDVFLFDVDDTISTLYAAELTCATAPPDKRRMAGARAKKHVEMIAFALQNVLLALNEHPHIRFHRAHDGTGEFVAKMLEKQMESYAREHMADFAPYGSAVARQVYAGDNTVPHDQGTLLIIDRTDDLASVLAHDTTYGSLLHDVLDHVPYMPYLYKQTNAEGALLSAKEVTFSDEDPVWRQVRSVDAANAIELLRTGLRVIVRKRREAELKKKTSVSMAEMISSLEHLMSDAPLLEEKYSMHIDLANLVTTKFSADNVRDLVLLEQEMLMGVDDSGDKTDWKSVKSRIIAILDTARLSDIDQARLIIMYFMSAPTLNKADRDELIAHSQMPRALVAAFTNLPKVRVPLERGKDAQRPIQHDISAARQQVQRAGEEASLCRFVPEIQKLVQAQLDGTLPRSEYPYVKDPDFSAVSDPSGVSISMAGGGGGPAPGTGHGRVESSRGVEYSFGTADTAAGARSGAKQGRSGGASWGGSTWGGKPAAASRPGVPAARTDAEDERSLPRPPARRYDGGRLIVFFVGGVTLQEITLLQHMAQVSNREIIVGGTNICTPLTLLGEVRKVELEEEPDDSDSDNDLGLQGRFADVYN